MIVKTWDDFTKGALRDKGSIALSIGVFDGDVVAGLFAYRNVGRRTTHIDNQPQPIGSFMHLVAEQSCCRLMRHTDHFDIQGLAGLLGLLLLTVDVDSWHRNRGLGQKSTCSSLEIP